MYEIVDVGGDYVILETATLNHSLPENYKVKDIKALAVVTIHGSAFDLPRSPEHVKLAEFLCYAMNTAVK